MTKAFSNSLRYKVLKNLLTLCIPTVVEYIFATLMMYVDTAMVGHLGEGATASVSCSGSVQWLIHSLCIAASIPFVALISRACGEGNKDRARRISGQAMWFVAVGGIIITAISLAISHYLPGWMNVEPVLWKDAGDYFFIISLPAIFRLSEIIFGACIRGTQNTRTPMIINIIANLINAGLNALFIYGLGMGVQGAAIGSAVSIVFAGVFMFIRYRKIEDIRWNKSQLAPDKGIIKECLRISLPTMATGVTSCMGYVFFASMVSSMGTTVFAAHAIAVSAEELFYVPGYGFKTATSAAIGYAIGEGDKEKTRITEEVSIVMTLVVMLLTGTVLFFIANPFMTLFTSSQAVAMLGASMLKIVAFTEPFFGLMTVMEGIFYGMGRTKGVFIIETLSMWGVRILFTFFVTQIWMLDLTHVWYCMIADNITKATLLFVLYIVMRRRRNGKTPDPVEA